MKYILKSCVLFILAVFSCACDTGTGREIIAPNNPPEIKLTESANANLQTAKILTPTPDSLEEKFSRTDAPVGKIDFANRSYLLPHGWQDATGKDAILENGRREISKEQIGLRLDKIKYFDVTGDNADDAIIILQIETGGSATPKVVYVFTLQDGEPNLIWHFRTGDRADGGLKNIYPENGELVVELFGQDRYIFGETETMKIVGDESDLCCPTHFTRSRYAYKGGKTFIMQGKRETFSIADKDAPPIENMGDLKLQEQKKAR